MSAASSRGTPVSSTSCWLTCWHPCSVGIQSLITTKKAWPAALPFKRRRRRTPHLGAEPLEGWRSQPLLRQQLAIVAVPAFHVHATIQAGLAGDHSARAVARAEVIALANDACFAGRPKRSSRGTRTCHRGFKFESSGPGRARLASWAFGVCAQHQHYFDGSQGQRTWERHAPLQDSRCELRFEGASGCVGGSQCDQSSSHNETTEEGRLCMSCMDLLLLLDAYRGVAVP